LTHAKRGSILGHPKGSLLAEGQRLRVPRWRVEDPLNLLQVMLAKGFHFTAFPGHQSYDRD
jgi:hypothetical protein